MPARSPVGRLVGSVVLLLGFLASGVLATAVPACKGSPTRPAPAACTYSVAASVSAFDATGGTASLGVSTAAGCSWAATSHVPWIGFASGASGTGPGTITFRVDTNAEPTDRAGVITVATESTTIRQAGLTCTYAVSPMNIAAPATGTDATIEVSAPEACAWTAACTAQWVDVLTGSSGHGTGSVAIAVGPHTGSSARTATVNVAGHGVVVVQSPTARCDVEISSSRAVFGAAGGTGGFEVTAPRDCQWSALSDVPWVAITAPRNGESDGRDRVEFTVASHLGADPRTGAIRVANASFTIDQAGTSACHYSVTPTEIALDFVGMSEGRIVVDTTSGCPWTVACDAAWILLIDASSRSGPGVMRFRVDPYTGAGSRRDAIRFRWPTPTEGQNVWITQTGCLYTLNPERLSAAASGGQWTVNVYSSPVNQNTMRECSWRVTAEAPWIRATPSVGYGFDRLTVVVDPNPSSSPREGTVLVERVRLTVSQAGVAP